MRVLLVNKFLYPNGGSETYVFELGKLLEKNGHEVQYFGMEHPDRIVGNRVQSYTSGMDFHTGKLAKLLYPFRILYSTEARRKIRAVLQDFDPQIVHLNNFNFQLTPSILYEIRAYEKKCGHKIRVLFTAHDYQLVCPCHMLQYPDGTLCDGNEPECIRCGYRACIRNKCIHGSKVKSILGAAEGWLYRHNHAYRMIDLVIAPSGFMKKQLECNPDLKGRIVVQYNHVAADEGAHGTKQEPETQRPEQSDNGYVLYFGRLVREKGVGTMLEACKTLPDISFCFAGSGDLEEEIRSLPNAKLLGFLNPNQMRETIRGACLVVVPSEWYENCPFSVMESILYGTPVVGAKIGGIPELIKPGVNGELFESGNAKELAEILDRLWNDPEKLSEYRKECGPGAYASEAMYFERLMELYKGQEG